MEKLSGLVIRFRWLIIILFVLITVLMAIPLKDSAVDPDVENMLPEEMRVHLKELEKRFGGMEINFVVVEDKDVLKPSVLDKINKIAEKLKGIDGENVQTKLIVDGNVMEIEMSKEEYKELSKSIMTAHIKAVKPQ